MLIAWLILYWWRPDTRKQMLVMSGIFALGGPIAEVLMLRDWWSPQFVFNLPLTIEDLLTAASIGGIASVIYLEVFRRKLKLHKISRVAKRARTLHVFYLLMFSIVIYFGTYFVLGFNSLWANVAACAVPAVIIFCFRKDLITVGVASGLLLIPLIMLSYFFTELLTPGWIHTFWHFKNTPRIVLGAVPLDDILWYFFAGLFLGPLYEFWEKAKIEKAR
ncbi:MAG TPA: lycopene cyclase domain-containing protein [Patescibacteria group bacterium]|nr:lycopene cyclase domain-containing protein [Patescibacteria group bacterium]